MSERKKYGTYTPGDVAAFDAAKLVVSEAIGRAAAQMNQCAIAIGNIVPAPDDENSAAQKQAAGEFYDQAIFELGYAQTAITAIIADPGEFVPFAASSERRKTKKVRSRKR